MKQVLAVHDLSGFGRCSLSVVLQTLGAQGIRGIGLPTAVLSAHTAFPGLEKGVFLDLTAEMEKFLAHWDFLDVKFDGFYSGFLGSEGQIQVLKGWLQGGRMVGLLVLVDPVMGDHGKAYRTYTPEMCQKMAELAALADVITPNLTEAALLLGETYDPSPAPDKAREWLKRLSLNGKRSVVITGLSGGEGLTGAGCFDRETGEVHLAQAPLVEGQFSGTGDLFASVVFGKLLSGHSLASACDAASDFVSRAARATIDRGGAPVEGADFEPLLGLLME